MAMKKISSVLLIALIFSILIAGCTSSGRTEQIASSVNQEQNIENNSLADGTDSSCDTYMKSAASSFVFTAEDASNIFPGTWDLEVFNPGTVCNLKLTKGYGQIVITKMSSSEFTLWEYEQNRDRVETVDMGDKAYFVKDPGFASPLMIKKGEKYVRVGCSKPGEDPRRAPKVACSKEEHISIGRIVVENLPG